MKANVVPKGDEESVVVVSAKVLEGNKKGIWRQWEKNCPPFTTTLGNMWSWKGTLPRPHIQLWS